VGSGKWEVGSGKWKGERGKNGKRQKGNFVVHLQQQISELIEKSFYLCGENKLLLNEAKDMMGKEI
jgi:hypothetical protein